MAIAICGDCSIMGLVYPIAFNKSVCCSCYYKAHQSLITLIIYQKEEILTACWLWVFVDHVEIRITDSYRTVKSPYW